MVAYIYIPYLAIFYSIQGWDNGITGMCVGEQRQLTVPSDLGYGDRGSGANIPVCIGVNSLGFFLGSCMVTRCVHKMYRST